MVRKFDIVAIFGCALMLAPGIVVAQSKDRTSQTGAPTTQEQEPSSSQNTNSDKPTIKVDPVKAVKTIIDIFGRKKPKAPEQQPTPTAPTAAVPEPAPVQPEPAQTKPLPLPRPVATTRPAPPRDIRPVLPRATQLSRPTQQAPSQPRSELPAAKPAATIPAAKSSVPAAPAVASPTINETPARPPTQRAEPDPDPAEQQESQWLPWLAAAIAAALAALGAWFFIAPKPRYEFEFETGASSLEALEKGLVLSADSGFNLTIETGMASTPSFRLSTMEH